MIVLKFGGTSVGTPDRLRKVAEITSTAAHRKRVIAVVSAANGVTDRLVEAARNPEGEPLIVDVLRRRHLDLASQVLSDEGVGRYRSALEERLGVVQEALDAIRRDGFSTRRYDAIIAEGERISVPLVSLLLEDAGVASVPIDTAPLVATDDHFTDARVDFARTRRQIRAWLDDLDPETVPVVTGFIGSSPAGDVTTLGRSGTDYTAAIFASCLSADRVERWTDVDGIYTDDPGKNPDAKRLATIVLETAQVWNHAGRIGMHPKALDPLVEAGIPLHVRCTDRPEEEGTLIVPASVAHRLRAAV